jgi:hypothetical protein
MSNVAVLEMGAWYGGVASGMPFAVYVTRNVPDSYVVPVIRPDGEMDSPAGRPVAVTSVTLPYQ